MASRERSQDYHEILPESGSSTAADYGILTAYCVSISAAAAPMYMASHPRIRLTGIAFQPLSSERKADGYLFMVWHHHGPGIFLTLKRGSFP